MSSQFKNSDTLQSGSSVSEETLLKVAKEITVKFIEVGRITPSNFATCFNNIYSSLEQRLRK